MGSVFVDDGVISTLCVSSICGPVCCSSLADPSFLLEWAVAFLHRTMGQTGQAASGMTAALHPDFGLSKQIKQAWYLYGVLSVGRAQLCPQLSSHLCESVLQPEASQCRLLKTCSGSLFLLAGFGLAPSFYVMFLFFYSSCGNSSWSLLSTGGLPLAAFNLGKIRPYQRGFFCTDDSIKYPFHTSTITSTVLYTVGFTLPISCVSRRLNIHARPPSQPIY